jgi:transposase
MGMKRCPKLTDNHIEQLQEAIKDNKYSSRETRRAQAIIMLDGAADFRAISGLTGFKREYAYRIRKNYLVHGLKAIADKQKKNPKELLTKRQREELVKTIKGKSPKECNRFFTSDYWTTGIVAEYIKRTYDVAYKSKTSIYVLFRQARFSYHKPGRVYERRNEQEVQEWRNQATKRVKQAWGEKDTVILTEDEMSLSTQTTVQKIWLPQGEYPKIEVSKKRESRSIYGFLNIKTGQEHAFKTPWQNMYITAQILKKIRKAYPVQKLLLVWDQAPSHKGSKAQEIVLKDGNIETLYFPRAAPEQNPQEHVWKSGRSEITHNEFIKDIDKATNFFVNYLNNTTFPYELLGFRAKS